jgi:hypothetical protein
VNIIQMVARQLPEMPWRVSMKPINSHAAAQNPLSGA